MSDDCRIYIPNELLSPAEFAHYEGTYNCPVLKSGPDLYSFTNPITYSVDVMNTGDALLLTGTAEGVANVNCSRCLEPTTYELVGEIEGYYIIDSDGDSPEDMEADEFEFLPEDNFIDLEPLIVAALLLDAPLMPICDDDCKGLCPQCGTNLNLGDCGCVPQVDTPAENPFAVLKDLQFD